MNWCKKIPSEVLNAVAKHAPEFETAKEARKEAQFRIGALRRSDEPDHIALADTLEACSDRKPCGSGACPCCCRRVRARLFLELMWMRHEIKQAVTMTLVPYDEAIKTEELLDWSPTQLKHRIRKQFERSGIDCPVIGGLDIDYHVESGRWMPHYHFAVFGDAGPIETMRERFYRTPCGTVNRSTDIERPIVVRKLRNAGRQLTYIFKSHWTRIEAFIDKKGNRQTRKYRLEPHELRSSLLAMDKIGYSGRLFLYRAKWAGNRIVANRVNGDEV